MGGGIIKTFPFMLIWFHETILFVCMCVCIYLLFKYSGLNKLTATLFSEVILKLFIISYQLNCLVENINFCFSATE